MNEEPPVRVRLKGIHRVKKRLADGSTREYFHAWRGGPRLDGKPGSPAFIAAYEAATRTKVHHDPRKLIAVLQAYQASAEFTGLASRIQEDYVSKIKLIEREFGGFPIAALADRRGRADFLQWRDKLATRSRRQADYALTVLARIISWAYDRGMVEGNPLERVGKVYRGSRADKT